MSPKPDRQETTWSNAWPTWWQVLAQVDMLQALVHKVAGSAAMLDISAQSILSKLAADSNLGRFIAPGLAIPAVKRGTGPIKLIILGQDPTVKNAAARAQIKTVLNLDKKGGLRVYLAGISQGLGLDLNANIYATNYLKCFFTCPPTQMKEIDIFQAFGPYWLPLLLDELKELEGVPVVALGEPLFFALRRPGALPRLRDYWGYQSRWQSKGFGEMGHLTPEQNALGRVVFPFPHQPSIRKTFYKARMADYLNYARRELATA
jgi:hypothetical protein